MVSESVMRELLKEVTAISGVAGSCIFDRNGGALCSDIKDDLPENVTENMGVHLVRLVQMGATNKLNIKSSMF